MDWKETLKKWTSNTTLDEDLLKQLQQISENEQDLEDAFYKNLTFGTGGMRGMLGPGTNRMNIYTIRKAVEGLALYLEENVTNAKARGVAVAYDSRYMSQEFAVETARVLGAHGIKSYVFESLRPTPLASFAVRHLQAAAGVMITASHNPPEYNGFKVYNEDGGQLPLEEAAAVIEKVEQVPDELQVKVESQATVEEKGLLNWIGSEVDTAYLANLKTIQKQTSEQIKENDPLQIVFTPLHGTAHDLVLKGLKQAGFSDIHVVKEQAEPDPEFSTVASPNPEEHQAFEMAIQQGKEIDADILIGTDPDADRLGVAVKDGRGSYQVLTGNQLGTLLLDYTLSYTDKSERANGYLIKTIVTTEMGRAVADYYDVGTIDTLTGFKFIGEKMKEFDQTDDHFLFGYEESYGYLLGDFVRDKDAVQAAVAASEVASFWKTQGKTLLEALETLHMKHGYYLEGMKSLTLKGKDGAEQIATIMKEIRENPFEEIGGLRVEKIEDYQSSERLIVETKDSEKILLPKENVMKFLLENNSWVCFRPSGTEPKIKSYFGVKSPGKETSEHLLEKLQNDVTTRMDEIIEG
ncbi:phospho-sugar mutase [Saliterribacillus persicus]|uniref:Phosphoglucomutase n=1 Tax=Saliterribacillus persicus TaxID=930114 RepID=A0A368YB58_9BACI|nr:phospho-sugar mutase [Saliterribacillus persicus]RCW77501.1 alpha-phosphoglucomutase [Saliterribacillus persicus]